MEWKLPVEFFFLLNYSAKGSVYTRNWLKLLVPYSVHWQGDCYMKKCVFFSEQTGITTLGLYTIKCRQYVCLKLFLSLNWPCHVINWKILIAITLILRLNDNCKTNTGNCSFQPNETLESSPFHDISCLLTYRCRPGTTEESQLHQSDQGNLHRWGACYPFIVSTFNCGIHHCFLMYKAPNQSFT